MLRQHYFIDASYPFQKLLTFPLRHKNKTLFGAKPMVVVEYPHQLVPEFFGFLKKPHVSDVHGVKSARDRDDYFVFPLFAHTFKLSTYNLKYSSSVWILSGAGFRGFSRIFSNARTKASLFPPGTTKPFSPFFTISPAIPTSVITTGKPCCKASTAAIP